MSAQGQVIDGRYELGDVLGRGGMGTVWSATDRRLQRTVAVKEVTFGVHLSAEERAVLRERTMREARAAARLDHPCVATVFDVVEEDGKPWLVMEHVDGRSLQDLVAQEGPLPPATVARIGLDVLDALEAAHAEGIVHRDVKPANVLVTADGHACLTDFGIATSTGDPALTTVGAMIGSPAYMAPERSSGTAPPSVDLWSLGATLYTAVEGRLAFDRDDPMTTLLAVALEPPAPVLRAGPLAPVLGGLLTKDPRRRATVAQARRDLRKVAAGAAPAAPARASGTRPAPPPPPSAAAPEGRAPAAPARGPAPAGTAPRAPTSLRAPAVERIDADDLRRFAEASRSLLGSAARGGARYLRDRRRSRTAPDRPAPASTGVPGAGRRRRPAASSPAPPAPERRRFKRRWVVVPTVTVLVAVLLVLVGAGIALFWFLGLG